MPMPGHAGTLDMDELFTLIGAKTALHYHHNR